MPPTATPKAVRPRTPVLMLLVGMMTYGAFYTGRQNFGIAASALKQDLHLAPVELGLISGSMLATYALGSILSGYLADHIPPRLLVAIGAAASLLLNWLASFAHGFHALLVPWALNGLAQSLGWAPVSRMVTSWWPPARRASVFGVLLFAAGLSSLATYALSLTSLDLGGWRAVFRLPVLTLIPVVLLFPLLARTGGEQTPAHHNAWHHYRPLLRNPRFLSLCASIGCESLARYGLLIWVPIHLLGQDWKQSSAGRWLVLALPLGMALGALSTGFLSDKIFRANRARAIQVEMLLGMLLMAALFVAPRTNLALGCVLLLLAGFAVYGPQAAYWTVGGELAGESRRGIALGMLDSAAYVFAAFGETLLGFLVGRAGTTLAIFPALGCACLLAALFAIPAIPAHTRPTR